MTLPVITGVVVTREQAVAVLEYAHQRTLRPAA